MSKKITLKTIENILREIDCATNNKNRTIFDIENRTVRELVEESSRIAIKNINKYFWVAGSGFVVGGAIACSGAVVGGTVTGGTVAGGLAVTTSSFVGSSAAATGATVGSVVPVVGTIIGAAAGVGIGLIAGIIIGKKQKNMQEALIKEICEKQNNNIRILNNRVEDLKKELNEKISEQAELQAYVDALLNEKFVLSNNLYNEVMKKDVSEELIKRIKEIIRQLKYLIGILTLFGDIEGSFSSAA